MLNIKLDEKYIITSDKYTYILSEYKIVKDNTGKDCVVLSKSVYPMTLSNCLRVYKKRVIMDSGCTTLSGVLKLLEKLEKNIDTNLKGV